RSPCEPGRVARGHVRPGLVRSQGGAQLHSEPRVGLARLVTRPEGAEAPEGRSSGQQGQQNEVDCELRAETDHSGAPGLQGPCSTADERATTSLPGRRMRLLKWGSIGRETLVVLSVGGL